MGKLLSNAKALYKEINSATLTGAIDVVAVEREDGTYVATPFHVRFGKLGVLRSKEKVVYIEINGEPCDLCMKLGDDGEAFFVEDTDEQLPRHLTTSPIPTDVECGAMSAAAVGEAEAASSAGKWPPPAELSRVLSDSALFVPGMWEQHRERHESENGRLGGGGGGLLLIPPPSTSAAYFEPIGVTSQTYLLENESLNENGGSDRAADNVPSDPLHHTAELKTISSGTRQYPVTDSEATPASSPIPSRPTSPKSDTELETTMAAANAAEAVAASVSDSGLQHWYWGELPRKNSLSGQNTSCQSTAATVELPESSVTGSRKEELKQPKGAREDSSASASGTSGGGLLSFMRKPKSSNKIPEDQGIYLEDLKLDEMDPEVAALYFPKRGPLDSQKELYCTNQSVGKDDDAESGRGPSVPHSPRTVMELRSIVTASPTGSETDTNTPEHVPHAQFSMFGDIAMSLCGGLKDPDSSITLDKFMHHFVTFEDFCKDPNMFGNPNLVIRMHGKFFNWKVAAPMVMSLAAFSMPLPDETVGMLTKQHMPKEERRRGMFSTWWGSKPKVETAKEPATKSEGGKASVKPPGSEAAAAGAVATATSTTYPRADGQPNAAGSAVASKGTAASEPKHPPAPLAAGIRAAELVIDSGDEADDETTAADFQYNGRIPVGGAVPNGAATGITAAGPDAAATSQTRESDGLQQQPCYRKTLRLSSDQLKRLKLHEGSNDIEYSVTTALQGTTRCLSHVYVWKWTDKIVVSDIDGTITRSDVLGQLLPMVGKDWSQGGVVQLYNRIAANGYKFVYLSARAIGQAQITRDYLRSVRQQQASLPPGPLLLSPTSLVQAFQKEVIERKPEEFKISCLRDIKSLFPGWPLSALYAGFGNKINDVWAYRAVDIPMSRIFTINPKGELRHELSQTFVSSYARLSDVADHFFPPVQQESSDYSTFAYWRQPLPYVPLDLAAN